MKTKKEIEKRLETLQKAIDELEDLLTKTKDNKVIECYMQTRKDVKQDILTLEWVLR